MKSGGPAGHLAHAAWNEAEDVLAKSSGMQIGILTNHYEQGSVRASRILGRMVRRTLGPERLLPPITTGPPLSGCDHAIFLAHGVWDLCLLEQLRSLRRSNASISVWIPEIWPPDLTNPRIQHECFSMIDHLFVGIEEAVEPFSEFAPNATVQVLTPAADVLSFAPRDPFATRGISVLGIGRRDPQQHHEILEWARTRQALYVYDTVKGRAVDWAEHRAALASYYQHANVAICNYAKHDAPEVTQGLRVLPGRLFEGLAAGTILVGIPSDEHRQNRVLGQMVVEPLDDSPAHLSALLDRFSHRQEVEPIRVRNLALACRGHDWAHRWETVFEVIGLPVPFGIQNRVEDLAKQANAYEELADSR